MSYFEEKNLRYLKNERANKSFNETSSFENRYINRSRSLLYKRKRNSTSLNIFKLIALIFVIIFILCMISYSAYKYFSTRKEKKELEGFTNAQMKQDIYIDFGLLGFEKPISIRGLTKQEVYDKILGSYDWHMVIYNSNPELEIFNMPKYGAEVEDEDLSKYYVEKSEDNLGTSQEVKVENPLADIDIKVNKEFFLVPDFIEGQAKKLIDDIYDKYLFISTSEFNKKNVDVNASDFVADFKFEVVETDEYLDDILSQLSRLWDTKAYLGQIDSFSTSKNEFIFGHDHKGYVIDKVELKKRIISEVNQGKFDSEIWTVLNTVESDGSSVKSKYRYVSNFETWTTDNEDRNNNINLACKAINGLIVKPGQEFSFNNIVGIRSEEKGYKYAPAYLEGQVVDELGGGVCQVSTTLYNAVFAAGLLTTYRKSHTFEPSYITPGLDATVSYNGPDYRFINNSEYSVGIRATYTKQKIKIEIFAVPLLKKNQTQNLVSKKIQDLDYPTLSIINEGKASKGSQGSEWQVFKVVKENDKEIERIHDHYAKYQGHTPTAFEENTYIDDDGILQTKRFHETRDPNYVKKLLSEQSIATESGETAIRTIVPNSENEE